MRIRQVSELVAKPMLRIGPQPVLWHIMRTFSHYGFRRFVLCLGYLGHQIKSYFLNYYAETADIKLTFSGDQQPPEVYYHMEGDYVPNWEVVMVDTGPDTMTGGRIARVKQHIDCDEFMLAYGDGVGDVNLRGLLEHHRAQNAMVTVTGVRPPSRFGHLDVDNDRILAFTEKPQTDVGIISGGFFVMQRDFIDGYLRDSGECVLERDALPVVARDGGLHLYRHEGFWMPMDNHIEYKALNDMWARDEARWKVW